MHDLIDLNRYPLLRDTMFGDRATQFFHRQGWDVTVDAAGRERDGYDAENPLYVIWQRPDGRHGAVPRKEGGPGPPGGADHAPAIPSRQSLHRRAPLHHARPGRHRPAR